MMEIIMMGIIIFVNRHVEIKTLQKEFNSFGQRLIIIYGRRRTGKTHLAVEVARHLGAYCCFLCEEFSIEENVERFAARMVESLHDILTRVYTFAEVFEYLMRT